jgi:CBS domain-containing protein
MFDTKAFMTSDVITVKRQTPISEIIKIFVENDITGLPVVEDDMTLVGIISEKDILNVLLNEKADSAIVEDFMTKEAVSFEQDTDFITICECLLKNNFRRVPILKNGKLVGIISRRDLIKYICEPIEYT